MIEKIGKFSMTVENHNNSIKYNSNGIGKATLVVGIVIALILLGIAAIYAVTVFEKQLEQEADRKNKNPLLLNIDEEVIHEGKTEIPSVTVSHAEEDIIEINRDAEKRQTQFRERMKKGNLIPDTEEERQLMQKKNNFAAERLSFLRKIEEAETKAERIRLIKELQKLCEENE